MLLISVSTIFFYPNASIWARGIVLSGLMCWTVLAAAIIKAPNEGIGGKNTLLHHPSVFICPPMGGDEDLW